MPTWAPIHYFFAVDKRIYPSEPTFNHTCLHRNCKFNHHRTHTSPLRERNLIKCRCSEPEPDVTELATGPMSRKKGDLAQAGPASTRARAGTPTASPADTVRTFTLHPPPLDRCQALCPSSKKLNTHTPSPQALRSLIPTLRVKVDVMPSGSYAAWYARLFVVVVLLPRS